MSAEMAPREVHTVSVVIPVYRGETTLPAVVEELTALFEPTPTSDGHVLQVTEVLLAYDNGPDRSDRTIRELAQKMPQVRPIWLSRNFGQHAATLAGIASSGGDWIVTMDEDGQHDPAYIPAMLDTAMRDQAGVVYAQPTNSAPHGLARNIASKGSKWLVKHLMRGADVSSFQSYRFVLGEVGRSVAAYAGAGVYLDVAMMWVNARMSQQPVELRHEGDRPSGYSGRTLLSHFWRLVLTSGTRGLRLVSVLGVTFAVLGLLLAVWTVVGRLTGGADQPGWAPVLVVVSVGTGAILFSLGVVAEYVGVAVNQAMGRPLFLIHDDPDQGPLGRPRPEPRP
jgi:undecaprenyl-phosphate 4-deoxy-4-formamido-L-arabinose transferase